MQEETMDKEIDLDENEDVTPKVAPSVESGNL